MDVHVMLGPAGSMPGLRDRIARIEDLGVAGVFVSDHLFFALGRDRRESYRTDDPIVVLGAIAAMSDRLTLGTLVANAGLAHPALLLRHFAQLAALVGGDRVLAGIGAGWNTEEFDALGIDMPPHGVRADRLDEACQLARSLFDDGIATIDGDHVITRALPMTPKPDVPPRLLLGGGSDRFLELAGRHADVVDLNGSSRRRPLGRELPVRDDRARRHGTTVDDLVHAAARVREVARGCGRPAPRMSILVDTVALSGTPDDTVADCPYVLVGPPPKLRDVLAERTERIGLDAIVVSESPDLEPILEAVS